MKNGNKNNSKKALVGYRIGRTRKSLEKMWIKYVKAKVAMSLERGDSDEIVKERIKGVTAIYRIL